MNYSEKYGSNVEEAVKYALQDLRLSRDEVEVEVLEEPSKGFLGLGSKLAKVRVTPKQVEEVKEEPVVEEAVEDIAALVKDEFGEKAEPLYPRIVKYFQIMESYHFVNFINKPEK